MNFYYLSEGKLFLAEDNSTQKNIQSEAIAAYLRTVKDIRERREWKSTGQGARFMGAEVTYENENEVYASIEALATSSKKIVYAISLENTSGIYSIDKEDEEFTENYILKKADMRISHLAYSEETGTIIASFGSGGIERHLAVCNENTATFNIITEGNSIDITPSFSKKNSNEILFSSAGFYVGEKKIVYGAYVINKLNTATYNMEEILADEKYDFLYPQQEEDGTLYCIRRPKTTPEESNSITDIAMVPVRMAKAVFGWMNVFSQMYTGESLLKKSGGNNPTKEKQKTEGELFIEGNLINVEKTLQENSLQDSDNPGVIPKNWELIAMEGNEPIKVIAKGVMSYCVNADGTVIYSDGRYIKYITNSKSINPLQASFAKNICE